MVIITVTIESLPTDIILHSPDIGHFKILTDGTDYELKSILYWGPVDPSHQIKIFD